MSVLDSQSVLPEFIKLRWMEPYASSALNRKTFKTIPRGVYNGFVVKPGPGAHELQIVHDDVSGWGLTGNYQGGDFDGASGWSVAVHAQSTGYTTNIVVQAGPGRNYVFDILAYAGMTIYPVIDVQYIQGAATLAQVKLVQAADLDANPDLLSLARVDVPGSGTVTQGNISYDDPAYPRITPFADKFKYGYMSPVQAQELDFLQSVSGSPAFNYEVVIPVDGPQDIDLPSGFIYTVGADDLWVFKNGFNSTKGSARDYIEVDRGDGHGDHITWVGATLRAGDRVKLRIQKYASVLSSTLQVFDEHALIDPNVVFLNFTGPGVEVFPAGPRSINVRIGGGAGGATKSCYNSTASIIPSGYAVTKVPGTNAIKPCDPTAGDKLYGITTQDIPPSNFGNVQTANTVTGAPSVSGFGIMDDLYVSMAGDGSLQNTPPDPGLGSVIRVGFADGADSVSGSSLATDIVFERGRLT